MDNYSHKPQYFDLSYGQLREGAGRPNTVLAASWEGKMALSFPLRKICCVSEEKFPQKPYTTSFIDQAFSVKMAGYLICTFLRAYGPRLRHGPVHKHAKKDLTNIQPFWRHAWSITHTYRSLRSDQRVRPMVVNALRGSSSCIWYLEDFNMRGLISVILSVIAFWLMMSLTFFTSTFWRQLWYHVSVVNKTEWLLCPTKLIIVCFCSWFWPRSCTKHNARLFLSKQRRRSY